MIHCYHLNSSCAYSERRESDQVQEWPSNFRFCTGGLGGQVTRGEPAVIVSNRVACGPRAHSGDCGFSKSKLGQSRIRLVGISGKT
jgi:hypothetical protein